MISVAGPTRCMVTETELRDVPRLPVEVAYATPLHQRLVKLSVPQGTTALQAIEKSGIRDRFPEIEPVPVIGIFSRKVAHDHVLAAGDRVEIYRPLEADPREARRLKVEQERAIKRSKR